MRSIHLGSAFFMIVAFACSSKDPASAPSGSGGDSGQGASSGQDSGGESASSGGSTGGSGSGASPANGAAGNVGGDDGAGGDAPGAAGGAPAEVGGESQGGNAGAGTDEPTPPQYVNGCETFVDRTADAASRSVIWNMDLLFDPSRCMRVKLGQTVTFVGDHDNHPMIPSGGDEPNPLGGISATFDTVGTFGYRCIPHPSEMNGAILVEP